MYVCMYGERLGGPSEEFSTAQIPPLLRRLVEALRGSLFRRIVGVRPPLSRTERDRVFRLAFGSGNGCYR